MNTEIELDFFDVWEDHWLYEQTMENMGYSEDEYFNQDVNSDRNEELITQFLDTAHKVYTKAYPYFADDPQLDLRICTRFYRDYLSYVESQDFTFISTERIDHPFLRACWQKSQYYLLNRCYEKRGQDGVEISEEKREFAEHKAKEIIYNDATTIVIGIVPEGAYSTIVYDPVGKLETTKVNDEKAQFDLESYLEHEAQMQKYFESLLHGELYKTLKYPKIADGKLIKEKKKAKKHDINKLIQEEKVRCYIDKDIIYVNTEDIARVFELWEEEAEYPELSIFYNDCGYLVFEAEHEDKPSIRLSKSGMKTTDENGGYLLGFYQAPENVGNPNCPMSPATSSIISQAQMHGIGKKEFAARSKRYRQELNQMDEDARRNEEIYKNCVEVNSRECALSELTGMLLDAQYDRTGLIFTLTLPSDKRFDGAAICKLYLVSDGNIVSLSPKATKRVFEHVKNLTGLEKLFAKLDRRVKEAQANGTNKVEIDYNDLIGTTDNDYFSNLTKKQSSDIDQMEINELFELQILVYFLIRAVETYLLLPVTNWAVSRQAVTVKEDPEMIEVNKLSGSNFKLECTSDVPLSKQMWDVYRKASNNGEIKEAGFMAAAALAKKQVLESYIGLKSAQNVIRETLKFIEMVEKDSGTEIMELADGDAGRWFESIVEGYEISTEQKKLNRKYARDLSAEARASIDLMIADIERRFPDRNIIIMDDHDGLLRAKDTEQEMTELGSALVLNEDMWGISPDGLDCFHRMFARRFSENDIMGICICSNEKSHVKNYIYPFVWKDSRRYTKFDDSWAETINYVLGDSYGFDQDFELIEFAPEGKIDENGNYIDY